MSYQHLMGSGELGDISVTETAISVFVIVTVPVVAGVALRRYVAGLAQAVEPWSRRISTVLFVLVLAGAIFQERDNIVPYFADAAASSLSCSTLS